MMLLVMVMMTATASWAAGGAILCVLRESHS